MLHISAKVGIPDEEIEIRAIRSQGSGGQNVNKVATAIHLFFDIQASSLPDFHKQRLLKTQDHRISGTGVVVIKAQETRSQEKNKEIARARLQQLVREAVTVRRKRRPTRPTRSSKEKRLKYKAQHSLNKSLRRKPGV